MRASLRLAILLAIIPVFLAAPARVARADETAAQDARALDLFEKSEAAYDSGRFADAVALLKASYAIKKEPVLLYNLGRAYEGIGDPAAAAQAYEAFLAAQPSAPDRGALERRIATLRAQLAERDALRKRAQESAAAASARRASAVPWVVAGVGAAGLVAGGVVGILAHQRNEQAKQEPTYARADVLHAQAQSQAMVSTVCFIAGGVVLAGGLLWGILDVSAARRSASLTGGGLALTF
jgi:tetratricopeptide (TPR) repeat protein